EDSPADAQKATGESRGNPEQQQTAQNGGVDGDMTTARGKPGRNGEPDGDGETECGEDRGEGALRHMACHPCAEHRAGEAARDETEGRREVSLAAAVVHG